MAMEAAETLGLIKGLTEVVQQQTESMKHTKEHIDQLVNTVENLAKIQPSEYKPTVTSGLRLPNFVLPEFTEKEQLDRFLEHLQNLLISSNVPRQYWVTHMKQQCIKDSRAYDALVTAEQTRVKLLGPDVSKAGDHDHQVHFESCSKTLREKRGKPRDQQIRELLLTYYVTRQQRNENVADFAHRFCETQRINSRHSW